MTATTLESLEKRVTALERRMAEWNQHLLSAGRWKDWRQAVGRFVPSDISEEIDAAGRAIRAADRQQPES